MPQARLACGVVTAQDTHVGDPESLSRSSAGSSEDVHADKRSRREVRWALCGAVLAAVIALVAGVVTAYITATNESEQSQADFRRNQRIAAYSAFTAAEAAFSSDLFNAQISVVGMPQILWG